MDVEDRVGNRGRCLRGGTQASEDRPGDGRLGGVAVDRQAHRPRDGGNAVLAEAQSGHQRDVAQRELIDGHRVPVAVDHLAQLDPVVGDPEPVEFQAAAFLPGSRDRPARQHRGVKIEILIEAKLADGLNEEAVAQAQALAESEPLRDRPRSLLMRAMHANGRQAEALRVYSCYRRYLADETGLDPSEEIVELERRVARGDASLTSGVRALRGYELGERIGEGAFAVVHRAVQPGIEREVAVKIIRAELADQPDFIRRFEFEARTVARIEHPNVVPLFDFWREPGAAYLVMRLLQGGTVEQALRTSGPYSREQTMRLLDDVGGALETAHQAGVVHRDVRPANLLLDAEGTTYLADFGIALPTAAIDDLPTLAGVPSVRLWALAAAALDEEVPGTFVHALRRRRAEARPLFIRAARTVDDTDVAEDAVQYLTLLDGEPTETWIDLAQTAGSTSARAGALDVLESTGD